ncbi:ABC transporter substrate-binding protein [Nocardioides sp. NPDC004968]|uniref:ABC transporter substrate-binding protein n=1 Tax=Nocardioides sp. NPDC004968 TaxID=3155894 RepID=UPI0033B4DB73
MVACSGSIGAGEGQATNETFVIGITSTPSTLNPALSSAADTSLVGDQVFDGLVRIDREGIAQPMLATEWDLSKDGLTLHMLLRDEATFHDGEPVTANDVKYSLEQAAPVGAYGAWIKGVLDEVEVVSDHELNIRLQKPFAPLLNALARERVPVLPSHLYEGTDVTANEYNMKPVGSGPYKFDSIGNDGTITLVANDDYWGEVGAVKTIILRTIPDPTVLVQSLQRGEVDFVSAFYLPNQEVEQLQSNANVHVEEGRIFPTYTYLAYNVENGPLQSPEVRRAIYKAIDRDYVNKTAFMGLSKPAQSFIPSVYSWAQQDQVPFAEELAYDLDEAAELLDEAGYPEDGKGKRFTVRFLYSPDLNPTIATVADAIKANLAEVGITLDVQTTDAANYITQVYTDRNYDMTAVRLNTGGDPSLGISRVYVCNEEKAAYRNASAFCDPDVDAGWAAVAGTNGDGRGDAAQQVQLELLDTLPSVPLIEEVTYDGVSSRFDNLEEYFDAFEYFTPRVNLLQ